MNYKSSLTCFTLLTASAFAAPGVWAQGVPEDRKDSGFFVTGSYGGYKSHGGAFEDENDLIGVSAGYHFNPFFTLEADYLDFGKFGDDDVSSELKGLGVSARGRLPVTDIFGVYAKAGAFSSSFDVEAFDNSETYDEVNPYVGAGVDFKVSRSVTAYAEYDRFNVDIDEDDFNGQITNDGPEFDTVRVGLGYTF